MFENKKVGDIIDENTKVLTKYVEGYDVYEQVLGKDVSIQIHENIAVVADYKTGIIICFKDDKAVALFSVYEIHHVSLNGARGLLKASGHETIHEYWFDNGEYSTDSTR